jgi:hypothetical protein
MHVIRFASAVLAGVVLLGATNGVMAGKAPEISAEKLKAVLGERSEVQFLSFTPKGTLMIGGVAPYGTRASSDDNASRVSWADSVKANWVEWTPATGALEKRLEGVTPKAFKNKVELLPPVPKTWVPGDSKRVLSSVPLKSLTGALGPKSFKPEVRAVSPGGDFVAVTNYEDKDDGLGALIFLRANKNEWTRVGEELGGVFLASPLFNPDGRLLLYRYQPSGYDGPEPWALVSTVSGTDRLNKGADILAYAVAMDGDMLAVAWSDGTVNLQPLDPPEP